MEYNHLVFGILVLILFVTSSILCYRIADQKNIDKQVWPLLALFFIGPLALIPILLQKAKSGK